SLVWSAPAFLLCSFAVATEKLLIIFSLVRSAPAFLLTDTITAQELLPAYALVGPAAALLRNSAITAAQLFGPVSFLRSAQPRLLRPAEPQLGRRLASRGWRGEISLGPLARDTRGAVH